MGLSASPIGSDETDWSWGVTADTVFPTLVISGSTTSFDSYMVQTTSLAIDIALTESGSGSASTAVLDDLFVGCPQ